MTTLKIPTSTFCQMCTTPLVEANRKNEFSEICSDKACLKNYKPVLSLQKAACWGEQNCKKLKPITSKLINCYFCSKTYFDCGNHQVELLSNHQYICYNCRTKSIC